MRIPPAARPIVALALGALLSALAWIVTSELSYLVFKPTRAWRPLSDLFVSHPDYGFELAPDVLEPGSRTWTQTNGQGYRETCDIPEARRPGELRITFFGDSIPFGHGVKYGQGVCEVLERLLTDRLRRIDPTLFCEVVNTAVPCWSQYQVMWRNRRSSHDPDLRIIGTCSNDPPGDYILQNLAGLEDPVLRESYMMHTASSNQVAHRRRMRRLLQRIMDWSALHHHGIMAIRNARLDRLQRNRNLSIQHLLETHEYGELLDATLEYLGRTLEETRDTPVILVLYPHLGWLAEGREPPLFAPFYHSQRERAFRQAILELARRRKVPVLDASRRYLRHLEEVPAHRLQDLYVALGDPYHPSALGHRIVAEALAEMVEEILPWTGEEAIRRFQRTEEDREIVHESPSREEGKG